MLGIGHHDIGAGIRAGITAQEPRPHFKRGSSDPVGRLSMKEA